MGRSRNFLISLIFLSMLPPQVVYASGINKTECKSKGSIRTFEKKKYICTKSNKKLIWVLAKTDAKKPSKKSQETQEAEVQLPYTPWTDPISPLQISIEAKDKFRQWLQGQNTKSDNLLISIDPKLDKKKVQYLVDVVKLASETLLGPISTKPHLYISAGDEWVINQVKTDYPIHQGFSAPNICYAPNPFAGCAWSEYGMMFFVSKTASNWDSQDKGVLAAGAHEFFHLAQGELSRNQEKKIPHEVLGKLPSWFLEGSASFMGTAYADFSGMIDWETIRRDEISAYIDGRGRNEPISTFTRNDLDRPQPEAQSHRPYGIGFLASELIVASVGVDKFLDVYRNLGLGQTFDVAFKNAIGLEVEDFYNKFDSMRTKIGFFPVIKN
ncbi:MAG: hypothetical protein F2653_01760 [Actinobacteria bacterium]|uniref:Unannotated protein n=1 Tax=freshwater metagenome TaxID=449393 RepID=A0A6J6ZSJ3_9ZZZZ|nr:hypothetical protein [Actinomycetota bacterium]MSW21712.1 hypothetical protein [Actinomycetota bacterium]MSX04293.1 hypothetical protein [Actinomycetota bacterium]MSX84315.1 hypothetical protein [Actinomycetota bacterium]MSY96148.1 hypothetical protein [Actinomycetota bacterium]